MITCLFEEKMIFYFKKYVTSLISNSFSDAVFKCHYNKPTLIVVAYDLSFLKTTVVLVALLLNTFCENN